MRNLQTIAGERLVAALPRVLSLLDKNPLSTTYGCLDRKYWQYKIIDFPSGMQQELARVLAWASASPISPYHGMPRIREFALAAIRFHARMIHPDGSLDDYFPYERALGATGYAVAALADACRLLQWTPDEATRKALLASTRFIVRHTETGLLSNHHAIAVYALAAVSAVCNDLPTMAEAQKKAAHLATLQHEEGWFPEYEGCDLGYQTVTLEFIARAGIIDESLAPAPVTEALLRFLRAFAHPDGSFGGEYGSRNTYNFYPGGFALLAGRSAEAREILGLHGLAIKQGTENHLEDDGVFGHMLSSWITVLDAPETVVIKESAPEPHAPPQLIVWPGAELFTGVTGTLRIFGNTTKGGCFKIFDGQRLAASDTGYAGTLAEGGIFCQNKPKACSALIEDKTLSLSGRMQRFQNKRMTKIAMLGLRMLCLFFGFIPGFSQAIRSAMQKVLIYNKKPVPVLFTRNIQIMDEGITVEDTVTCENQARLETLYHTTDLVNLHVVTSDSFQATNLLSWQAVSTNDSSNFTEKKKFTEAC